MPSKARLAYDESSKDVRRLVEIHTELGGEERGRRHQLEVLNKSAIILITAIWEAYCEDIVTEAVNHLIKHSANSTELSKEMKKSIAKELKSDLNEIAIWDLADEGWRKVLEKRTAKMQEERNRRLNTPKAEQIRELFQRALGIEDITAAWSWQRMPSKEASAKLDRYVTLRGEIAHRGTAATGVTKAQVEDYVNHINQLVGKTGGRVNAHAKSATGKVLW